MYDKTSHYNGEIPNLHIDKIYIYSAYSTQKHQIYSAKKYGMTHALTTDIQLYIDQVYQADYIVFPNRTILQQCKSWNPNLAKILAKKYAKNADIPLCSQIKKQFSLTTQKTSSKKQRQDNIQESFVYNTTKLKKLLHNKNILLIDDIISSGSTANEVAKICKNHGAKTITGYFFSSASV